MYSFRQLVEEELLILEAFETGYDPVKQPDVKALYDIFKKFDSSNSLTVDQFDQIIKGAAPTTPTTDSLSRANAKMAGIGELIDIMFYILHTNLDTSLKKAVTNLSGICTDLEANINSLKDKTIFFNDITAKVNNILNSSFKFNNGNIETLVKKIRDDVAAASYAAVSNYINLPIYNAVQQILENRTKSTTLRFLPIPTNILKDIFKKSSQYAGAKTPIPLAFKKQLDDGNVNAESLIEIAVLTNELYKGLVKETNTALPADQLKALNDSLVGVLPAFLENEYDKFITAGNSVFIINTSPVTYNLSYINQLKTPLSAQGTSLGPALFKAVQELAKYTRYNKPNTVFSDFKTIVQNLTTPLKDIVSAGSKLFR
jgi:hypothetical protein